VASFSDNLLGDTTSAFTATIDWGDGTQTPGVVVGGNGSFTVEGGHTYTSAGDDDVGVTVTDTADSTQLPLVGTVTVNSLPVITAPAAAAIGVGQAAAIAGGSMTEGGNTTGETFTVTVADSNGLLPVTAGSATVTNNRSLDPRRVRRQGGGRRPLTQTDPGLLPTAVGTGLGALTVTVTISGFSHTFTDQTSSSIFLDDGSVSGNNEMTLNTLNQQSAGSMVNESFTLDADDPLTAFITGTDLVQNFTESPFISNRSFQILDIGPNVTADGAFTINTLALNGAQTTVPEPASALLLLVGVVGIAMRRLTTARAG